MQWQKIDTTNAPALSYAESIPLGSNDSDLVIFIGGLTQSDPAEHSALSTRIYALNMKTLEWKELETTGDAPLPRWRHSATLVGNKIVVHGGDAHMRGYGAEVLGDVNILDVTTWAWSGTIEVNASEDSRLNSVR